MSNKVKFITINLIFLICTGILLGGYVLPSTGKKQISEIAASAFQKTIDADYRDRANAMSFSLFTSSSSKKVAEIKIRNEKGVETIHFKDSMDSNTAHRLSHQFILAQINPVNPDSFNVLLQKHLQEQGIVGKTGIIYQDKEKTYYSQHDSLSHHNAIRLPSQDLDIKKTVRIQAWIDCGVMTILKHANFGICWGFLTVYVTVAATMVFYRLRKRKTETKYITVPVKEPEQYRYEGIVLTPGKLRVSINNQVCILSRTECLIMHLLINEPNHLATKKRIIEELWPEEAGADPKLLSNRIDVYINRLRNLFSGSEHPKYEIKSQRGIGYLLAAQE